MNATLDRKYAVADNLIYIAAINAFFWLLALAMSFVHLRGTAGFERLLPVLLGGAFVAGVAVVVAWRRRDR